MRVLRGLYGPPERPAALFAQAWLMTLYANQAPASLRLLLCLPLLLALLPGCRSESSSSPNKSGGSKEPAKPFVLGDMVEEFNAPTLEALEAEVEWKERPVLDGLEVMRELLANQDAPELTAEAALRLKNNSPMNNDKLCRALGQLAPASGSGVNYGTSVVRHVGGDLKSTNPLLMSSVTESEYHELCGIGLFAFDKNFDWFGLSDVIKNWHTSRDRLVDKVVLRDDLTWSDGKPVTAHDFEFSFKAIMTDAVIVPAIRQGTEELKFVKAYDDHTLVFFHKEALPTNTENMMFVPIPKHAYAGTIPDDPSLARSQAHSQLEDNPVVAGPYELVKRNRGHEFVLRRRKGWHIHNGKQVRAKPYFKEVRVKRIEDFNTALTALESGDIEQMELRAEQWVTQTNDAEFYERNTKVYGVEWTEFHFVWNVKSPLFADSRVRWAMTYAMDYEELMETICYGLYQQSQGNYHPDSWMFPKNASPPVTQDLEKAQDLLTEAGWEDTDGDGLLDKEINGRRRPFEFTLLTYTTDSGKKTATLMKECLDLLGIQCNVKPTEFTVLQQKARDHEFDGLMAGWGTGVDPSSNVNIFGTDKGRNYGSYSNPKVDELFEAGKRESDRLKRAEIYGKIHMQLWEDQPYTWLFYRNSFYGFNKKLRGYNFSPRGPFGYSPGFSSVFAPVAAP